MTLKHFEMRFTRSIKPCGSYEALEFLELSTSDRKLHNIARPELILSMKDATTITNVELIARELASTILLESDIVLRPPTYAPTKRAPRLIMEAPNWRLAIH